ncbi:hypothetical protein GCM10020229_62440 [Kitasatospora albolonga]|uniref:DUF2267 domain-containing protein n=1 Tax=Kitasatospora albolonga TaxID=68173 RepID=UPI0031EDE112
MTHRRLIEQIRANGHHTTDQETESVLAAVLTALGGQLAGDERCALAAVLPEQDRALFAAQIPAPEAVAGPAFVEAVARTLNTTLATARWDTTAVLAALADLAGEQLTDRLLAHLPRGYALLFGRADLAAAA